MKEPRVHCQTGPKNAPPGIYSQTLSGCPVIKRRMRTGITDYQTTDPWHCGPCIAKYGLVRGEVPLHQLDSDEDPAEVEDLAKAENEPEHISL